jgi:hypothetical protein
MSQEIFCVCADPFLKTLSGEAELKGIRLNISMPGVNGCAGN